MEFRVLGAVEADQNGRLVDLGRRRERCLLGLLLLEVGRVVSADRLIDLLWDGSPSELARGQLSANVSRLRSRLDPGGVDAGACGVRVSGGRGGYLIEADPASIDVHRFQAAVDAARGLPDPATRAVALGEALSLWRGPLLGEAADDHLRGRVGAGLEELRLTAVELQAEAALAAGQHDRVAAGLVDLVNDYPTRERLVALLMQAVYRCGRQADALAVYRNARQVLVGELGLEPGPPLRLLHDQILRNDPALAGPVPTRIATVSTMPQPGLVPAQLPPAPAGFTGRAAQLSHLDTLLPAPGENATPTGILTITGTAGVGKTALAVYWAHRVRHRFPDGQLYMNLRGFDPTGVVTSPADAVRAFLDAFQVPPHCVPASLPARIGLYRSLLANKRVLVVLDDARDSDQVRPLLPGTPGCCALVTSRDRLTGLVAAECAQPLSLDVLAPHEARQMLTRRLGAHQANAEPETVDEIIARCAGLPLALAIVAARALTHAVVPLAAMAEQLRNAPSRLDPFDGGDPLTDIRAVFSRSYQNLSEPAARLFRLLGLHPGPDIGFPAVASLAGVDQQHVRRLLGELVHSHLVNEAVPGRFVLHDLLHAYATEQACARESDAERRSALGRVLDHYLHTAYLADRLIEPQCDPIPAPASGTGADPQRLTTRGEALAWLAGERRVLVACIQHAAAERFDSHAWQLAWILATYFDRQGDWRDLATTQHAALAAAGRPADKRAQAHTHEELTRTLRSYDIATAWTPAFAAPWNSSTR
jgi:DNA-binding SARP family transcriptional activator